MTMTKTNQQIFDDLYAQEVAEGYAPTRIRDSDERTSVVRHILRQIRHHVTLEGSALIMLRDAPNDRAAAQEAVSRRNRTNRLIDILRVLVGRDDVARLLDEERQR